MYFATLVGLYAVAVLAVVVFAAISTKIDPTDPDVTFQMKLDPNDKNFETSKF